MKFIKAVKSFIGFLASAMAGFWWIVMSVFSLPRIIAETTPSHFVVVMFCLGIAVGAIIIASASMELFGLFSEKEPKGRNKK